jgi:uncharacterized DUF497 family protein
MAFLEASTVCRDPLAITYPDPDHSVDEQRYVTIGISSHGRVLFVAHAEFDDRIRMIRARRATRRESYGYTQGHI